MSSSDETDEENAKKLQEAVDTSLLFNNLYQTNENDEKLNNNSEIIQVKSAKENNETKLKSERYLNEEESFDLGSFKVSESMQKFFAKKLSSSIEKEIEFVEIPSNKKILKKLLKNEGGLKLLNGCDYDIDMETKIQINGPTVKPVIKKRKFELDHDDCLTEKEKIKLVAVTSEDIINKIDMKYWKDRKKSKVFTYKSKSGPPFQFVEPDNEFSVRRRKNNWSLKKIARQNEIK